MGDNEVEVIFPNSWLPLDEMEIQVAKGHPCSMAVKVRSHDLLHANHLCIEGETATNVCDNDGHMINALPEVTSSSFWGHDFFIDSILRVAIANFLKKTIYLVLKS